MVTASKKRILFVDHTAAMSGAEIALLNLAKALDPRRFQPVVLLFSDGPLADAFRDAGIETHVIALASSVMNTRKDDLGGGTLLRIRDVAATLGLVRRIARFMRAANVSLVHTNSLKSDVVAGLAARAARLPLIWHVRDRIADDYLPGKVARAFRFAARVLPHRVIAISDAVRQTLGGNPRVRVVHDGTPIGAEPPPFQSDGQVRVGVVGRITPWKGQDVFLRAAAIVRKRFPDAKFQIIGSALFGKREQDFEQSLHDLVAAEGIAGAVEFTGFRKDVADLIARLDVLVHASKTGEPFGQVIIEGMAAAKPVIGTRGGAVPEIIVDGETGLLVPMNNPDQMAAAICALLADPARARQMGLAGRTRVADHFTIQTTARRVQAVYDDLLAPRNRAVCLSPAPMARPPDQLP
jgi:glycosyltransferase involved in cell wall biosynthesis